jgi:hypothetical protein
MIDNYDDGLVHGHRWATEPTMTTAVTAAVLRGPDDTALLNADAVGASTSVDAYDDGLVHSHTWAVQSLDR